MRIAYLHSGSVPSIYANGVHVMRMCDAFADAGHHIELYAVPGAARTDDLHVYYGTRNRFPVHAVPLLTASTFGPLLRAQRVRRRIRRGPMPDILYGRDPYALLAAAGAAPVVYETHLLWPDRAVRGVERLLFRHRALTRVVFVTQALAEDYLAHFPQLRARTDVELVTASDGADPVPPTGPVAALPGRPDALRVGYVGHLYPGRGTDIILGLAARLPDADFHLVGGTDQDRSHWQGRNSRPNVFFHGHHPPAALPPYYRAFDIVLAPYQTTVGCAGGFGDISRWVSPMKLFEYMAYGKAIIASDLPVLREVLADGVNCLLRAPADTAGWAAAIEHLGADVSARQALGDTARHQLNTRYTWRARVDRVLPDRTLAATTGQP
ncbi:glycosyltransferase family 4 protein [Streptomyces buecherae]|uniref:glycosyltransferase family 4 protein n=1 Tax=Streptomyces buecherae TaxID=2763006 RepID=UPI0036C326E5